MLTLAAASATAEQWQLQPSANLELRYDDNVRFTPRNAEEDFITEARLAVRAARLSEISDVGLAAGLNVSRYADVSEYDNTGGFLGFTSSFRGERNQLGLNADIDSQSTLTSEIATIGITQVNKQRYRFNVRPTWTHLLSERALIDVGIGYTKVFYEDVDRIPLFDYWLGTLNLAGRYRLTERTSLSGELGYGRYEASEVDNEYDSINAQFGGDHQFSETLSAGLRLGVRFTEETAVGADGRSQTDQSTGPTFSANLSNRFENGGTLGVEAVRLLSPSGGGELLDTTGLLMRLNYPVSPRWRFGLNASAYRNRDPGDDVTSANRTYADASPRLVYELAPRWTVTAGYRYRWEDRDDRRSTVDSNALFFTLAWGQPWDLDLSSWDRDLGSWDRNLGLWDRDLGSRDQDQGFWDRDLGSRDQDQGSRDQGQGNRGQGEGSRERDVGSSD